MDQEFFIATDAFQPTVDAEKGISLNNSDLKSLGTILFYMPNGHMTQQQRH